MLVQSSCHSHSKMKGNQMHKEDQSGLCSENEAR